MSRPDHATNVPRLTWVEALDQLQALAERDRKTALIYAALSRRLSDRCDHLAAQRQRANRLEGRVAELEAQLRRLTRTAPRGDRRRT